MERASVRVVWRGGGRESRSIPCGRSVLLEGATGAYDAGKATTLMEQKKAQERQKSRAAFRLRQELT
jgi:hypothetical protein